MSEWSSWFLTLLVVSLAVTLCNSTLSKSDRKQRNKNTKDKTLKTTTAPVAADFDASELGVGPDDVTVSNILTRHSQLDTGGRKFDRATLGYVTPWNSHGYDVAKWAANKFTHISPVWLQLKPTDMNGQKTCVITGTHDMDHGWIRDVRSNNSEISIMPRFLLEGWTARSLDSFLYDEMWQRRCVQVIVDFIERNEMQGAVVEVWLQILSVVRQPAKIVIELVESWAEFFHAKELQFILPLNPPLNEKFEFTGIITPKDFAEVAKHVDYVNIMLYDYHTDRPAGVAPLEWIERNLAYLLNESLVSAPKILLGLNFYGYEFSTRKVEAVTANRYLELLQSNGAQLHWDDSGAEHFVSTDSSMCYYPSLTSLSLRIELARQLNMGVAIWDIGQGLDYFTSLL